MRVGVAAVAAGLLVVAGCAGERGPDAGGGGGGGGGADELVGRTFLATAITEDGAPIDLFEGVRVSFEFTDEGRLRAYAACNTQSADVTIHAGRIETSDLGSTLIGCDPRGHEQDEWLAEFLTSSPEWGLDGDQLTLTSGAREMVLVDRRVADPDRPLAGSRWIVDSIVTGDVASSMAAGTEGAAWLQIDGEAFTAFSGCREITGRAEVAEGRIRFGDAGQTDPACPPELAEVDAVMVTVLSGEVEYVVEADRLRLDHPDGVGLGLHADE